MTSFTKDLSDLLPPASRARLEHAGIDLSAGYPQWPQFPDSLQAAIATHPPHHFVDAGSRADKDKKALFSAATEVIDLTANIGTEIVGLQLAELTNQQRDELALLIAERTVVFFRDQKLTPQKQRELGDYWGEVDVHPAASHLPGNPGVHIIWDKLSPVKHGFRNPFGTMRWHTDLVHYKQPAGITHLHNDTIPPPGKGGDTFWASGYSAYDKLSPAFRALIDPLVAIHRSAHSYKDLNDPDGPHKTIETAHPLVRVHPVTGWKSLFVNRTWTLRIQGLDPGESKAILEYLYGIYETSLDIQVRFKWSENTSALWDNRISTHFACYDHEGKYPRHGTHVASLAEVPYNDPKAPSRRAALGLDREEDFEEGKGAGGY